MEVLSSSQETRPAARGSGLGRDGRGLGLRPILQPRVKFTLSAPLGAAWRETDSDRNAGREAAQAPERHELQAGFSPKPSASRPPSESGRGPVATAAGSLPSFVRGRERVRSKACARSALRSGFAKRPRRRWVKWQCRASCRSEGDSEESGAL